MVKKRVRINLSKHRKKKEIKERRDIFIEEIAEETGLSYTTVSRWLNDKPVSINKEILSTFAEYFGIDPLDILETVEESEDPNYETALAPAC